jgi:hypothetical protein
LNAFPGTEPVSQAQGIGTDRGPTIGRSAHRFTTLRIDCTKRRHHSLHHGPQNRFLAALHQKWTHEPANGSRKLEGSFVDHSADSRFNA